MSLAKEIKMKNEIESIRHEALLNIVRTANCIAKISTTFFEQYHLTEAQYNVLIVLKLEGRALTQIEIGERLVTSRANMTSLLDKLEKKEYVRRETVKGDRRVYEVHLTEQGKRILEKVEKVYVEKVEEIMASVSIAESKTMSRLLEKLRESLFNAKINEK